MLLRQRIGTSPERAVQPQGRPVRLKIWGVGTEAGREENSIVSIYIALTRDQCTRATGIPIPVETTITVDLAAHEEIWAISSNEGYLGVSVLDR